jgi:anti-sigma factor RsiW
LSAYLDGELPSGTAEMVAAHLTICPGCRAVVAAQRRTKGDLRDLGGPLPSAGLLNSLMQLPGSDGPGHGLPFVGFATASVGQRKRAGMPLLAAGVAGVAALTVASAVLTGAAPEQVHHTARPPVAGGRVRTQADIQGVGHFVVPTAPPPAAARQPEGPAPIAVPLSAAVELVRGPG